MKSEDILILSLAILAILAILTVTVILIVFFAMPDLTGSTAGVVDRIVADVKIDYNYINEPRL